MTEFFGVIFILATIIFILIKDNISNKHSAEMKRFLYGHTEIKREECHTDSSWDPFWRLNVPSGEDKIDDSTWNDNWIDPLKK